MRNQKFFMSTILGLLLTGCATMTIRSDYVDPGKDFSALRTYATESAIPKDDKEISEFVRENIREAVDKTLQEKGYIPAQAAGCDFLVRYQLTVEDKTETLNLGQPYTPVDIKGGMVQVDRTWQAYNRVEKIESLRYEEGTLILDVMDPVTKKLSWRRSANAAIDRGANPKRIEIKIQEAVARILETFPEKNSNSKNS